MKNLQTPTWMRCAEVILALALSTGAHAAPPFTVNSTADMVDDSPGNGACHTAAHTCTLRAAIMEANRSSTGATINLPAGTYKLTLAGSGEAAGDLNLTTPASGNPAITISGAGAGRTIIDANHIDRAINVYPARTALIQGVTIRGGYNGDYGGAILNGGSLQLDHVDIGPLNVTDGTGGGIFNGIGGTLSLDHVSVIQNHGGTAGGIYNDGTLEVRSSSFVGNLSDQRGGGIENAGMVTVIDSTFASNAAASGGAIHNARPTRMAALMEAAAVSTSRMEPASPCATACWLATTTAAVHRMPLKTAIPKAAACSTRLVETAFPRSVRAARPRRAGHC